MSNGPKAYKLQRDIINYKQGNQTVLMYFNNLIGIWNKLDLLLPHLDCVCEAKQVEKAYGVIVQVEDQLQLSEGDMDHMLAMQVGKQAQYQYKGNVQSNDQGRFQ